MSTLFKKFFLSFILLFIITGFILGQDSTVKTNENGQLVNESGAILEPINFINLNFCDTKSTYADGKGISLVGKGGGSLELCINISNGLSTSIELKVTFTDGILSNLGSPACSLDPETSTFGKFVQNKESLINIPANTTITRNFTINLPIGLTGIQKGCITYNLNKVTTMEGVKSFDFIFRKVNYIQIIPEGSLEIKNSIEFGKNIETFLDKDNNLNINFSVKNNGNIEQKVKLDGKITNILGYKETFDRPEEVFPVGYEKNFTKNINSLPSYKGPFTLYINGESSPSFNFNTDNLPKEAKQIGTVNKTSTIFLFSRILFFIGLILILFIALIIKLLFFKKRSV